MAPARRERDQTMALLNQRQLFEAVTNTCPDVLTRSVYQPMQLAQPLFKMPLQEKRQLFVAALRGMLEDIGDGRSPAEVAYATDESGRLFSFGLQPMWEVREDKGQSRLVGLESLLALHTASWGVGIVVDVLDDLLDTDIDLYLQFKGLEIQAALDALETFPSLPPISVNVRPSEWLLPGVQSLVLDATRRAPGRIVFELTEYTQDLQFKRLFGEQGSLSQCLTRTLLPVLRRMREAGVKLLADDLLPFSVYCFDGEESCRKGHRLVDHHATESSMMLSSEWSAVFHGVKISLDWVIHAMSLGKQTGAAFASVPIYAKNIKDNPGHVAAVTGKPVSDEGVETSSALRDLQKAARVELQAALQEVRRHRFDILPVLEATLPPAHIAEWGLEGAAKEQGGMFFEARFPPAWFFGQILSPPLAQRPKASSPKKGFPSTCTEG
ncbi:unnamed protein product [Prorocentrum cordatum]|uniref:Uncharacterized protein n=1 Tax=Prorocentrum cordatum TaxID=2364126 RepID=A0ABN9UXM2_9DINO|nr:unnamed protein product [Polarella glacialis]